MNDLQFKNEAETVEWSLQIQITCIQVK